MRRFLMFPIVGVVWLVLIQTPLAHGIVPRDVPVDRLVENLTQYSKENPNDAEGYYRLGRVHTLALETKSEFVIAYEEKVARPAEGSWAHRTPSAAGKPTPSIPGEVRNHLSEAKGFIQRDGTARATYDWISTSVIMHTTSRHELTEENRLTASRDH